ARAGVLSSGPARTAAAARSPTRRAAAPASVTGSAAVTVSPAAASSLVLGGYPSPTAAGAAHSFTVTARDPYGNTATGYAGTVHFTSSDGQAVLPADYAFTAADAGVHSFS